MTSARQLLEQALALPEEDRRRMAEALLDSVPQDSTEETEAAWRDEVMSRIGEVQRGAVELEPWSKVEKHLRQALDRG